MTQKKLSPMQWLWGRELIRALAEGGLSTRLSALIMGFGSLAHGQIARALIFFAAEVLFIAFMALRGAGYLADLGPLGSIGQTEIWDEAAQVYRYIQGDQSIQILLYGVATVLLCVLMLCLWQANIKAAFRAEQEVKRGKKTASFSDDIRSLSHENLHRALMTPSLVFIAALTILPLIFMICMAFTNYSRIGNHLVLFDWVGLENFRALFDSTSILGSSFLPVLAWTLVWAFFATFTNYFFGMFLALLINRKGTRIKGFWRFCFVLSAAIPMFVSLLIIRTMLQSDGAVNVLLRNAGLIAPEASLPFFTDPTWARVTIILVNIWVGAPYSLLALTGVLQNIPQELYEAARIDGASAPQSFAKITMPYVLYVTTPFLIVTFTGNVNNFNVIYLLSGGGPITDLASTAGSTDLLVTWLYKLTVDKQYYSAGAVLGILTFVILAVGTLITYRRSKSYKEEGGF